MKKYCSVKILYVYISKVIYVFIQLFCVYSRYESESRQRIAIAIFLLLQAGQLILLCTGYKNTLFLT